MAVINEMETPAMSDFRSGEWTFQLSLHRASNGAEVVHLEPKLVGVLVCLVEHAGRAVSKEELMAAVWPDTIVEEVALARSISELRRLLRDDARSPRYVETIPKLGYRWIAEVSEVAPERLAVARRRLLWPAIAVGLLAATGFFAIMAFRGGARARPASLVVLPFTNLSGAADQEYLADGVTEQLTTDLARLRMFRVISRTSAMTYKTVKTKSLPKIARELGVDAVVEGSVLRSGGRLRITAQFIDAATDKHLFSQTYECDLKDILTIQRDVALAIASSVRRDASDAAASRLEARRTVDPTAYRAYISGEYFLNKRGQADLFKAVDEFRSALDADPTSAQAYAGLTSAYAQIGYFNYLAPSDAFPKAKAAAARALELDPGSAEAHASLGYTHMYYDWDFAGAEHEFKTAIALNPSLAVAHQYYSVYLAAMLRPAEAQREIEIARTLDPLSVLVATDMGFILYYDRAYDRSTTVLRDAIAMNPKAAGAHFWLGRVYQAERRYGDAAAEYRAGGTGISQWPPALAGLGHMYGLLGERSSALSVLGELETMAKSHYVSPYTSALVRLGLSQKEETLALLERCYEERSNWLVWLLKDPRWDVMRSDPGFQKIVSKVGFPAEARARSAALRNVR